MIRATLVLVSVLALATTAPRIAVAQSTSSESLIEEGVRLREQNRDDEALARFEQAWRVDRSPRARAQMALAEQALGHWVEAEVHLREALAATNDPWISSHLQPLQQALADIGRNLGSLDVRGGVPGAEVYINGQRVAALPLREPVRVPVGTVRLEVRAPGYITYVREGITLSPEGLRRESVQLAPVTTPGGGGTTAQTTGQQTTPMPPPGNGADRNGGGGGGDTMRALGWAGVGVGGALLVGAAVALLVRNANISDYNRTRCPDLEDIAIFPTECRELRSAWTTPETLAIAGAIAGGAVAITGVVLLLAAPRSAPADSRRAGILRCGQGPGLIGLACGATF